MDRWKQLYRKFQAVESAREAREREVEERKAAFENWCRVATDAALDGVVTGLRARGEEFAQHTGIRIAVEARNRPPVEMGEGGPRMSFVRVSLATARIDLYSHREPGGLPVLHVVRSHYSPGHPPMIRHVDVIVSVPTCTVVRLPDDGWALRRVGLSGRVDEDGEVVDIDELVFEIFEMLVDMHTKVVVGHEGET